MPASHTPPLRTLRAQPDLDQLKRQAKELLAAFRAGEAEAAAEVHARYRGADPRTFALHEAQLVLARGHGFDSWPKLKAFVDGVTVRRLADAATTGDIAQVRALIAARPELANMVMAENDEHRAMHFAVLSRSPEIVRLLMAHGADARAGVYPHRDATTALALATARGDDEIVAIILEEERRRADAHREAASPVEMTTRFAPDDLMMAIRDGDRDRARSMIEADPALVDAQHAEGWTPLHVAAAVHDESMVAWLVARGADVNRRSRDDKTPLDAAADVRRPRPDTPQRFAAVAALLREHGAVLTPASAVALGEGEWLRARHAEGTLAQTASMNIFAPPARLLSIAVAHRRLDMVTLLLDLGLDPDERMRLEDLQEVVYSWGGPLHRCASSGQHAIAELLLARGADPNAEVYASGRVLYAAYRHHDEAMIRLLEQHGAKLDAGSVGWLRLTGVAKQLLDEEDAHRSAGLPVPKEPAAETMLYGAVNAGAVEILQMAVERLDWPRDDRRWHWLLWGSLCDGGTSREDEEDTARHLACFRCVLARCDAAAVRRFGQTVLHDLADNDRMTSTNRVAYATLFLDAGGRLDARDDLLRSTPLGWACRWGRTDLVALYLSRGADPIETDAEPWATPRAWAAKMGHDDVLALLDAARAAHAAREESR